MSQSKDKNLRRLFKNQVQHEIHELASKKVDEKIESVYNENKEYKKMVRIIARQRDVVFIIACSLLVSNIIFGVMWYLCK